MPVLGYLGYGPFAFEVFALFWFVWGFIDQKQEDHKGPAILQV